MMIVMAIAVGALFVVWIVTGVRLIRLARQTQRSPELLLGLALLLQAGIGYPISVLAPYAGDAAPLVWLVSSSCSNGGMGLLFAFTALVFHDRSRWAWMIVGAGAVLLLIQTGGHVIAQSAADEAARARGLLLWGGGSLALSGLSWGWTGFEALRYHARLHKRAALGLADPIVVNRMLLWGLMGTIALACVLVDTALLYFAGELGRTVLLPLVTASAGLLVSACMILAFWPPPAYLAWLRGRGSARG
jgi:hypothetical protein